MNVFREAKELLERKNGSAFTDEEWKVIGAATIPLNHPAYSPKDITIGEGLEELAKLIEEKEVKSDTS